jgi:hypothetical protein
LAYPAQSIQALEAEFYRTRCDFKAVVLAIFSRYLSAEAGCRNEAAVTIPAQDRNL